MKHRLAILSLMGLWMLTGCGGAPEPMVPIEIGATAPAFALKDLEGKVVSSESLAGKPVVLNFWATWCEPCRKEIPELVALAASGKAVVVGVSLDEKPGAVKAFVQKNGMDYQVLMGDEDIFRRYNGSAIPYTLVLDGARKIGAIHRGVATREILEQDLAGL